MPTSRRALLTATAAAALAVNLPRWAQAAVDQIDAFRRGAEPVESGLTLDIAASVENGAYVDVRIEAQRAPAGDQRVEAIMLVAPGNPRPVVAQFQFGPLSGGARLATRMRLAKSQEVLALARLQDGSVRIARRAVTVVVGGCDI